MESNSLAIQPVHTSPYYTPLQAIEALSLLQAWNTTTPDDNAVALIEFVYRLGYTRGWATKEVALSSSRSIMKYARHIYYFLSPQIQRMFGNLVKIKHITEL